MWMEEKVSFNIIKEVLCSGDVHINFDLPPHVSICPHCGNPSPSRGTIYNLYMYIFYNIGIVISFIHSFIHSFWRLI